MSLKETSYDTLACSGYLIEEIQKACEQAYRIGEIKPDLKQLPNPNVVLVLGGTYQDQNIPQFYHPIAFQTRNGWMVAVDVRPYGKYAQSQDQFVVRDMRGCESALVRAGLQEIWLNEDPKKLRNFSKFPLTIYCNWVSEIIAKRLGLEMGDQARLCILAAIFYQNQFLEELASRDDPTVLGNAIRNATGMKADFILEVMQQYPVISDLEDLCQAAKTVTQNVRTDQLNPGIVAQIAAGSWYGSNTRENNAIAVALEHPPTWISLMARALQDRGMRHSGLTKILERSTYRRDAELFLKQLYALIKDE